MSYNLNYVSVTHVSMLSNPLPFPYARGSGYCITYLPYRATLQVAGNKECLRTLCSVDAYVKGNPVNYM